MARTAGSHSALTAPRIREAAQALFARHGFAAVSMRQIAAEVGVQVGALYNYTPDKQSLLFDLMIAHLEELLAALDAEPMPDDPLGALEAFTRFHIRFHAERPDAVFIAYMELRNLTPGNFTAVEALRHRYEDRLTAILARGQNSGAVRVEDPRIATMAIIAMLTGVNTWYREGGRLSRGDVAAQYWAMARRAVGAGC